MKNHVWHFIQAGGLVQLKFTSIEDVLNLKELDPKLWTALACPVKGLEFDEETLDLLDTDRNGRVRIPEILEAVEYIRSYFKKPEVIMSPGSTLSLDVLGEAAFDCGYSPLESARAVLHILGKDSAQELTLDDVSVNDKLFSPAVINGDGVLPAEAVKDEASAAVISDIVACTGGSDDISGVKGADREQFVSFYKDIRAIQEWRDGARNDAAAASVFFMGVHTDAAAAAFRAVKDKINEYFTLCALNAYNSGVADLLCKKEEEALQPADGGDTLSVEQLSGLPIASVIADRTLPLADGVNPAWCSAVSCFRETVVAPQFGGGKSRLTEAEWRKIEADFAPYMEWYAARPDNCAAGLSLERVDEILASDAEQIIASRFDEEEKHPPVALACRELRKMLLLRRDFVRLLHNFVSFEDFYDAGRKAVFQCGTLYIDGRSCDLCFRVLDGAKHAAMSPLSWCYLLYCECRRPAAQQTMQIAAMVSAGSRDNLIVGRNGLFFDREGRDWDATVTKIIENPISIREAFWSPYKKLARMIQERIAKSAAEAEGNVNAKMAAAVDKPSAAAGADLVPGGAKKIDVGTIAAISVAFTGMATVAGGLLSAFFGLGYWIPLGVAGLMLLISLPSMFIAWLKLRQRNIAPILDASGWAVNGNVKITIPLGAWLTKRAVRPRGSRLNAYDPYAQKGLPVKRICLCLILLAAAAAFVVAVARNPDGITGVVQGLKGWFVTTAGKFVPRG